MVQGVTIKTSAAAYANSNLQQRSNDIQVTTRSFTDNHVNAAMAPQVAAALNARDLVFPDIFPGPSPWTSAGPAVASLAAPAMPAAPPMPPAIAAVPPAVPVPVPVASARLNTATGSPTLGLAGFGKGLPQNAAAMPTIVTVVEPTNTVCPSFTPHAASGSVGDDLPRAECKADDQQQIFVTTLTTIVTAKPDAAATAVCICPFY